MLKVKLINKHKIDNVLTSSCGISFDGPKVDLTTSMNKVGKIKTSQKIRFDSATIDLGVSAEIPEGLNLMLIPNSDLFHKYGVLVTSTFQLYSGTTKELKISVVALKDTAIKAGEPIAKIAIVLSDNASFWTKLQYMFNKVKIITDEQ